MNVSAFASFGQQPPAPLPLPQNVEAEQAFLGALLWDNSVHAQVASFLKADHFFEQLHQRIFTISTDLIASGQVVSAITIKQHLGEADLGDGVNTGMYLSRLAAEATTTINALSYARAVHDTSVQRDLIAYAQELDKSVREAPASVSAEMQIAEAETRLLSIRSGIGVGKLMSINIGAVGEKLVQAVHDLRNGKKQPVPSTGFSDLDRALGGGYRGGRLIVMGGRPGSGKTVFGVASARRVARQGYGAAFFSLEIDEDEMGARTIASELSAGFNTIAYRDILSGHLSDADFDRLQEGAERVRTLPMEIIPQGGTSLPEIAGKSRLLQDKFRRNGTELGVIFIDYLGLVTPSDRYSGRKVDEAGEIALQAKTLAKKLNVCVVLFSQLSRQVESRDDKRPLMSDLRDSGNIEEHADAVALFYRPSYYDKPDEQDKTEIIEAMHNRRHDLEIGLAKNRLGPTARVTLYCDVASSCVDNKRGY